MQDLEIPATRQSDDLMTWVAGIVESFCQGPENSLRNQVDEQAWGEPLLGFSRGDDPLYEQYKAYVGPFHWTPWEIFDHTFPQTPAKAEDLTVICWVLPQTAATRADNRKKTAYPAERWARSRIFGEIFNNKLRQHVVDTLKEAGHEAVAPLLSPGWQRKDSDRYVYSSTWSERHAAHASGLGTFGLCDGLITPKGKAVRVGSVVARLEIAPTPRPYTHHQEYCLFFSKGNCRQCMTRCPVGAITEAGHDKIKCSQHLDPATAEFVKANYGFDGYGCGLCQTGVPCESRIPKSA